MSKLILNILLSIVFFLIAIALVLILTPPCSLSKLNILTERCFYSQDAEREDFHLQIQDLQDKVSSLQSEILNNECSLNSFVTSQKEEVDGTRLTQKQVESFNNSDLTELAGCWELTGTSQTFYPVGCELLNNCEANKRISSNAEYCFDGSGNGQVKTEFLTGSCRAPTIAKFGQSTSPSPILSFTEAANAKCDYGVGFSDLVARSYECKLTANNRIACSTESSLGNSGSIVLKRKNNDQ